MAPSNAMGNAVGVLFVIIAAVIAFVIFFIPTRIWSRKGLPHRNLFAILNFFAGATGVGWLIVLAIAILKEPPDRIKQEPIRIRQEPR